jgi:small subunit ribosomal protein S2
MNITPKDLLDAGVHFGHQTKRWNPRFKPYLFDHRQGISVIDLEKTHACLEKACRFLEDAVANGGDVLFVGTKRQAQEIVREAAAATSMPFCASRWMGGTLTNFETIKRSIAKFKRYQEMETSGELAKMHKKEASAIKREMERMQRNFEGLAGLSQLPAVMIVIDINYEDIAVAEGSRIGAAVVALVDTNSDPGLVTHPIPGNDDAVKSIRIIVDALVESIQSGLSQRESRRVTRGQQQIAESRPVAAAARPVVAAAAIVGDVAEAIEETVVEATDEALAVDIVDEEVVPAPKKPAKPARSKATKTTSEDEEQEPVDEA